MLTNSTLESSINLATKLAKKNVTVTPKESTPLSQLVNASYYPNPTDVTLQASADVRLIKGSTFKNAQGVCEHDLILDEATDVISDVIKFNLNNARNVVNPLIKDIVEETKKELDSLEQVGSPKCQIVPETYHSVWSNGILIDLVKAYDEVIAYDMKLSLYIQTPTDYEELKGLLKTGIARLDREIEDFVNTLSEERVRYVFNELFGSVSEGNVRSLLNVVSHYGGRYNYENILLTFLFSKGMMQKVPDNVNMSLEEYKAYISTILEQSGRSLNRVLEKRLKDLDRKVLIYTLPLDVDMNFTHNTSISVNGDVYESWLKEGGEPEIILGSLITDRTTNYNELLVKKDYYKTSWFKHEKTIRLVAINKRLNNATESFKKVMLKTIAELDDNVRMADDAVYRNRLLESLNSLSNDWFNDIYSNVRRIVCYVFFPHTDSLSILTTIDEISAQYPEMEIREVGCLAVINIVADWLTKLMDVHHSSN